MTDSSNQEAERFRFIEIGETAPAKDDKGGQPADEVSAPPPPVEVVEEPTAAPPVKLPTFPQFGTGEAETLLARSAGQNIWRRTFYKAGWGRRPRVAEAENRMAYRMRLLTEYESRNLRYDEVRIRREPISSDAQIADLWTYSVERPTEFLDRTDSYPIAGTDQLVDCRVCNGLGLVRCRRCSGSGTVREQLGPLEPAAWSCPACSGNGMTRCEACRGYGQMRRFAVLVVRFEMRDLSLIADNSPIPDERLATVRGEQFFQRRDGRRLQLPQISDPINEGLRLLQERCAPRHDQMLLLQQAEAEAVPLVRARAEVGTGRGEFWVYGKDRRLFFPPGQALARLDWVRIAGALTVLFGAAALALYWLVR